MRARLRRTLGVVVALIVLAGAAVYQFRPQWLLQAEFARLAWRADVHWHAIHAGTHDWAYYEGGQGETVVLVHGFTGSKENWLDTARFLTPRYHVIIPDLPGWGQSMRQSEAAYGAADQATRLRDFLVAVKATDAHLVGHSMGGSIVGLYAAEHGAELRSLTLMNSAGVRFTLNEFARAIQAGELPFNVNDRAQWHALMHKLFVSPPWLPGRVEDVLIARNVADHVFHEQVMALIGREPEAFLLQSRLDRIATPSLVFWCNGDQVLDVSSVEAFRAGLPRARVVIEDGCGHMPMMERPAETARVLQAFFEAPDATGEITPAAP